MQPISDEYGKNTLDTENDRYQNILEKSWNAIRNNGQPRFSNATESSKVIFNIINDRNEEEESTVMSKRYNYQKKPKQYSTFFEEWGKIGEQRKKEEEKNNTFDIQQLSSKRIDVPISNIKTKFMQNRNTTLSIPEVPSKNQHVRNKSFLVGEKPSLLSTFIQQMPHRVLIHDSSSEEDDY